MAKLTKKQTKLHNQALDLLGRDILSVADKEFIFNNYHEGAGRNNSENGAFFTPLDLADALIHDAIGSPMGNKKIRVVDLCAGIGGLGFSVLQRYKHYDVELVCVEANLEYIKTGKKLVPEATWVDADILDKNLINEIGYFDFAISNPPFGRVRSLREPSPFNYRGAEAEYKVFDVASFLADYVAVLMPQNSASFSFSGCGFYQDKETKKATAFMRDTGINLMPGMGYDTTDFSNFKDVSLVTEFVHAETDTIRVDSVPAQATLF